MDLITPVEKINGIWFKREDKYEIYSVCGGKARSAYYLIQKGLSEGKTQFVTCGARTSPQCEIISCICEALKVKCHLFMPQGQDTSILKTIYKNKYSILHRTKVGYNNVLISWSKKFCEENNFYYIPFGMECKENIDIISEQVINIPIESKKIVITVGSGMSLVGLLNGLEKQGWYDKEVLGISVGKDPTKTINKYINAPHINYSIIKSPLDYDKKPKITNLYGIELDPYYESKCIDYIHEGDLFYIIGKRKAEIT